MSEPEHNPNDANHVLPQLTSIIEGTVEPGVIFKQSSVGLLWMALAVKHPEYAQACLVLAPSSTHELVDRLVEIYPVVKE